MGAAAAVAGLPASVSTGFSVEKSKPNILWIIAEDIGPDLGCYGNRRVSTPNLDKFATESVRYVNAFSTAPVCSPSRSALITGMYQTSIGAHNHRTFSEFKKPLPDGIAPITEYFREAGYYTVNVQPSTKAGRKKPGPHGSGKTDFNFAWDGEIFEGKDWNERKPGQPFFAQLSLKASHRGPWWDQENNSKARVNPDDVALPPYYPDHPIARQDWADYLNAVMMMDSHFGSVMKRLNDEGLTENTVVFFFGDEGRCMLRAKQWLYDAGLRIPLMIRWPGEIEPVSINDDLISGVDIAATSLAIAGINVPPHIHGIDFLVSGDKKRDYVIGARDRCDETVDRIRSVHTKYFNYIRNYYPERPYTQQNRYKDTRYPMLSLMKELHEQGALTPEQELFMAPQKPEEELYDLLSDPFEVNNVAQNPAYANILNEMRAILDRWIDDTGDQGIIPESQDVLDKVLQQRIEEYGF